VLVLVIANVMNRHPGTKRYRIGSRAWYAWKVIALQRVRQYQCAGGYEDDVRKMSRSVA
jgi:hypothetical protein